MSNLRVFDPFAIDNFDDVIRNVFRPARFEGALAAPKIKLDIDENPQSYQVKAELPGVKKEDIQVNINGNYVSINAEVKSEKEEKKDGKILRSERYYGAVSRAFTLGSDIDQTKVEAKLDNGVLRLTLPKKASSEAKQITIQ